MHFGSLQHYLETMARFLGLLNKDHCPPSSFLGQNPITLSHPNKFIDLKWIYISLFRLILINQNNEIYFHFKFESVFG